MVGEAQPRRSAPGLAISTIIGDIVHNLRPALDTLAYEMAVPHVGLPLKDAALNASAFPVRATPHELDRLFTTEQRNAARSRCPALRRLP